MSIERAHPGAVVDVAQNIFGKMGVPKNVFDRLCRLLRRAIRTDILSDGFAGIVIAGYGDKEYYPSIVSYMTDGVVAGKLKLVERDHISITRKNSSMMAPFAQRDAANLFMEGVDHSYQQMIDESIPDVLGGIANIAAKYFNVSDRRKISNFTDKLNELSQKWVEMLRIARYDGASRVLSAIDILDKSEMSALAESIVSVTALKQKVSLETETVGGPIDVAFISKGDGFIWIKRKHYFDASINPFFFHRYLEKDY